MAASTTRRGLLIGMTLVQMVVTLALTALGWGGWMDHRSGVGLVAIGLGFPLLLDRIASEEALLTSHFGSAYADYCRRTWRLVPSLY